MRRCRAPRGAGGGGGHAVVLQILDPKPEIRAGNGGGGGRPFGILCEPAAVTRSFSSLLTCGGLGPELDGCRSRSSTLYLICFEQRKVESGGGFACSTSRQLGFDGGEMRSLAWLLASLLYGRDVDVSCLPSPLSPISVPIFHLDFWLYLHQFFLFSINPKLSVKGIF